MLLTTNSVRVSNELGLQHPRAAKFSVYVTILQSLFIGLFCMFLLFVAGDKIISIYTNSDELHQAVAKLAWLLDLSMLLNSVQPVISGIYSSFLFNFTFFSKKYLIF